MTVDVSRAAGGATRKRRRTRGAAINLLYLPALIILVVFTVYPLFNGLSLSLTNWDGYSPDKAWVGLANFRRLLSDPTFHQALGNTFIYGIGSTLLQQIIGIALALAVNVRIRGRNVARALIYLPTLVSPVVMGTFYYLLFQYDNGTLNGLVMGLGGARHAWLSSRWMAVTLITLVNTLQFVGTSMTIYLAGLQSISPEYSEAATLDGASTWQRFWRITLPLLQPAVSSSVIINLIGGLKLFDVIQVLTGGGPGNSTDSVSTLISKMYFQNESAGYASAMGIILFIVIAIVTVIVNYGLSRGRVDYE